MQKPIYIIGYGDVGARIAPLLLAKAREVYAISRTIKNAIDHPHFHYLTLDLDFIEHSPHIVESGADILYLAPPPSTGSEEKRIHSFFEYLTNTKVKPRRIVYFSATGVYGDCKGEWINEETVVAPNADRSKRRLDAEKQLKNWCESNACEWVILRVAGIYGPNKLPIERLKKGMTVLREDIAPSSNRIHIDDLASITVAALDSPDPNEIYNVADSSPSTMTDYFLRVAKAFDLPLPRQVTWEEAQKTMSPQMLSYLAESKRLDTRKLLRKLHIKFKYPDLRSGLAGCVTEINNNN